MEMRDLIATPLIIIVVYLVAYIVRPRVTDQITRRYFFPALTVRVIGAIAVGLIYQFYYSGGDTYIYHTGGSRIIWEALMQSPYVGVKIFLNDPSASGAYQFVSKIEQYYDPSSFFVIQVATIFDLFTFSSYSATAVLFAVIAFVGSWLMFLPFYQLYPHLHKWLAWPIFFIPSVVFWGSGILKDTLTYASVGLLLHSSFHLFIKKDISMKSIVMFIISVLVLYKVKIYILLTFLPATILWVFFENLSLIKNKILRSVAAPVVLAFSFILALFVGLKAGEDNPQYSFNKIAKTAQITAYDIRYWSGRGAGSGYTLGELDGTFGSMINLAPKAVVVSLFRPFIWEVNNPLMLVSSLEASLFLMLMIIVLMRSNFFLLKALSNPTVIFCLGFSIVFAFAVGVSTYNFGSLVRYKIPLLPFFTIALILIDDLSRQQRIKRLMN